MSDVPPLSTQPGTPPSLAEALDLGEVDQHVLRGHAHVLRGHARINNRSGRMFGGEIAAQAVMAAHHAVPDDRHLHSLHGYFLLAGDPDVPVDHHVDPTRDGGSFTTRTVRSVQGKDVIFTMLASFQRQEQSIEHAPEPHDVAPPDDSQTVNDLLAHAGESAGQWLHYLANNYPWEFRFPDRPQRPGTQSDEPRRVWFRVRGDLPQQAACHTAALAHGSDLFLLGAALQRHGITFGEPGLFVTSLDHTIWFHEPPRVDAWLLYDQRSAWAGGGRALCRGRFWSTDGRLVATVAQEGLVRQR